MRLQDSSVLITDMKELRIPYGKSDYIPCIAWGRNARFAGGLEVGAHLQVSGRVQSREYTKKIGEEEVERRVAYEVSVSKIDLVEDEE